MSHRSESLAVVKIRAAYERSPAFRRRHGEPAWDVLPREPGEDREESNVAEQERERCLGMEAKPKGISADDGTRQRNHALPEQGANPDPASATLALGIELDDLEREFMDKANAV